LRFLIVQTDYGEFLRAFHRRHGELASAPYEEYQRLREGELFGYGHSYARWLRNLGHQAEVICANDETAQQAWARQHGPTMLRISVGIGRARTMLRPIRRSVRRAMPSRAAAASTWKMSWLEEILAEQVRAAAPDVLICLNVTGVTPDLIGQLRDSVGLMVGQHGATPLPAMQRFRCYDLILSSFAPTVDALRAAGVRAEPLRLGFDPDVLDRLGDLPRTHDISFVGSFFGGIHDSRISFVEALCERFEEMRVWTASIDSLAESSPIRRCYVGPAWGIDMFGVLLGSRITINHHGDFRLAANNCRLYEATGCGALLLTDAKPNLPELFDLGREVLAYEDVDHCVELIDSYLDRSEDCAAIAQAGRERTLRDHTYGQRMTELVGLVGEVADSGR